MPGDETGEEAMPHPSLHAVGRRLRSTLFRLWMYDLPLLLVFLTQGPALRFLLIFGLVLLLAPVLDPLMEFPLGPFEVVIPIRTLARYGPEFGLLIFAFSK
jgi:hypothetical protein